MSEHPKDFLPSDDIIRRDATGMRIPNYEARQEDTVTNLERSLTMGDPASPRVEETHPKTTVTGPSASHTRMAADFFNRYSRRDAKKWEANDLLTERLRERAEEKKNPPSR